MELEQDELVICTVEKIVGTVVFVKIPWKGKEIDGSITISEIAPGRIRNLRDYVVPKKRVVCKILRISPQGNVELSLRRVTQKEKKEIIELDKQEKSYIKIFKSILGENSEPVLKKITEGGRLHEFVQEIKENPEKLECLMEKKDADKILGILKNQKSKKISLKKEIFMKTTKPDGINLIKEILTGAKGVEIRYISAGRYSIKSEDKDAKLADNRIKAAASCIEVLSRQKGIDFSIKGK